jgi:two-component system chemotaxis response regulator CheY
MVMAEGQKEQVLEAVKSRGSKYIVNPFPAETLTEKTHKIFEN